MLLYVKFDGSFMPDFHKGTAACALYRKEGDSPLVLLRTERISFTTETSGETEFAGLILGLQTAQALLRNHTFDKVRVYGDSQVVFKHVRGSVKKVCPVTARLAATARSLIDSLPVEVEMYWTPRKNNLLADVLCRTAYCFPRPQEQRAGKKMQTTTPGVDKYERSNLSPRRRRRYRASGSHALACT